MEYSDYLWRIGIGPVLTQGSTSSLILANITVGPIFHLMFADDCLLVTRASLADARELVRILEEYCSASGQKVNASKSSIVFSPLTCPRVK